MATKPSSEGDVGTSKDSIFMAFLLHNTPNERSQIQPRVALVLLLSLLVAMAALYGLSKPSAMAAP